MVGHEYTSKLSRMFTDITVSKNLNKEYKQKCESTSNHPPIDLNVKLLTTGSWPYTQMFTLQMPVVLESTLKHFSALTETVTRHRLPGIILLNAKESKVPQSHGITVFNKL